MRVWWQGVRLFVCDFGDNWCGFRELFGFTEIVFYCWSGENHDFFLFGFSMCTHFLYLVTIRWRKLIFLSHKKNCRSCFGNVHKSRSFILRIFEPLLGLCKVLGPKTLRPKDLGPRSNCNLFLNPFPQKVHCLMICTLN